MTRLRSWFSTSPGFERGARWLIASLALAALLPLILLVGDPGGLALKVLAKGNLYVESEIITPDACEQNPIDDSGRCVVNALNSSLREGSESIARPVGSNVLNVVVALEAIVEEGEQTVGRRVGLPAGPTPLNSTGAGRRLFATATEWAAGPGGDKSWRALLVMAPTSTPTDVETALESARSSLGPRFELASVPTANEKSPGVDANYDILLLGHGFELNELPESIDTSSTPIVTWSREGWIDFVSSTAGTAPAERVSIDSPDHPMMQGLYGSQATPAGGVTRSRWALGILLAGVWAFTIVTFKALRHDETYRGSDVHADDLPAILRYAYTYENQRREHWSLGVRWLCLEFAVMATTAIGLAWWILYQDEGIEPDLGPIPDTTGGLTWAAFGLLIVVATSVWFSRLNLKPFRLLQMSGERASKQAEEAPDVAEACADYTNDSPATKFGVCLSGGGIRAAAFGLGGIQALQESSVWGNVDRLTAVSGGAYTAASYALLKNKAAEDSAPPDGENRSLPIEKPYLPESEEMSRLRNNTHYLAPGLNGAFRAFTEWLTGFLWNLALVLAMVWLVAMVAALVVKSQAFLPQLSSFPEKAANVVPFISWSWNSPAAVLSFSVLLVVAVLHMLLSQLKPGLGLERLRNVNPAVWKEGNRRMAQGLLIALLALIVLLAVVPRALQIGDWVGQVVSNAPALYSSLVGAAAAGWIASILRGLLAGRGALIAQRLAGLVLPVAVLALFVWAAWVNVTLDTHPTLAFAALAMVVIMLSRRQPARRVSLHDFYRDRLTEGFATFRSESIDTALKDLDARPTLYIGAVANIGPGPVTPPGRAALPWVFNSNCTGLESDGSSSTMLAATSDISGVISARSTYELTAMRAVAISGAAFSPAMGRRTLRSFRALMAILNLRLGVWLPNPLFRDIWKDASVREEFSRTPGQFPSLLKEAMGLHRPDSAHLYITDGGHYDNLGLVSLLRQGCRNIICFDASADGTTGFTTIADAMMLASAELGVEIDLDPERDGLWPIDMDSEFPESGHAVVEAEIKFDDGSIGHLLYCRASLTEATPWSIDSYRRRDPTFPNTSTMKQLYGDETFEAYRALGASVGRDAARAARSFLPGIVPSATS